jgi:hypothetical protein
MLAYRALPADADPAFRAQAVHQMAVMLAGFRQFLNESRPPGITRIMGR